LAIASTLRIGTTHSHGCRAKFVVDPGKAVSVVETLQAAVVHGFAAVFHVVLKTRDLDVEGSGQGDTTNAQLRNQG
jgi:hypothetical protein